jgi:glycosyltransferase Alg8
MGFAGNKNVLPKGSLSFLIYTLILFSTALHLPDLEISKGSEKFIFVIGGLAIWRYSWGIVHFIRAIIYINYIFPRYRMLEREHADNLIPSKIYLLVTSFRIESDTNIKVFRSVIQEAINTETDCVIIPSLVEKADEDMVKSMFLSFNPPERVKLKITRIPGTGKRDGLAQGFRAISRDMPPDDAVVAVIDGDTILEKDLLKRSTTFFKMMPEIGALTTDEECDVKGSNLIRAWHSLRFAQRQIVMSSISLSKKVLTLTGRMSLFRVSIVTNPDFIAQIENDHLTHWRFGKLKFLTGDDKSSWFWVLKNKWKMLYVPDVKIHTIEHPPSSNFLKATTMLMQRWSGNMLRTNERALSLPPHIVGYFTWWCLMDQRLSMWTSLSGPVFVTMLCIKYSISFLAIYIVWIGFTRWIMALMLLSVRREISWTYPFLLYYNQIYGSLIKVYIFFRLDKQSWTRQKTTLNSNQSLWHQKLNAYASIGLNSLAMLVFISIIGLISGVFEF